jgi:hypothetical protein
MREVFDVIVSGKSVDLTQFAVQRMLATGD